MSTPNEPADSRSQSGDGDVDSHAVDSHATDTTETSATVPMPAARSGQKPPWQRESSADGGQSAPPSRKPLVTGTAAGRILNNDAQAPAPITNVDVDGATVPRPERSDSQRLDSERPDNRRNTIAGKVIDGPTRAIDRADLAENLPDLDAIHHPRAEEPAVTAGPRTVSAHQPGPLRASVQLRRIDPWAAFKVSAVLSVAAFCVWMIATGVLYLVLDGMGVWDSINNSFGTLVSSDSGASSSYEVSAGTVFGIAALIGVVNMVLFTALATVGSFIYNLSADLVGGAEITLADRD